MINSQNLKLLVSTSIPTGTPVYADFSAAVEVGCPQTIGAIAETRPVKTYKCMSSDESVKLLGSIDTGNFAVSLLFDPEDTLGQAALKSAFNSNNKFLFGIELDDSLGANGTTMAFTGVVSGVSTSLEQDSAVMYEVTIEIDSKVTEISASAV